MNPYESPPVVADVSPTSVPRGTSLIWFAATVAGLMTISSTYMAIYIARWGDAASVFVHTLLPTALFTIPAVVIYASVSHTFKKRFYYASTSISLVVAGAIVALYAAVVQYFTFSPLAEYWVWLAGMVIAVPLSYFVSAIERLVAGPAPKATPNTSAESSHDASHASIFWFSGACLAFGFVSSAALQPGSGLYSALVGGLVSSAMLCMVGTAAYGALSACVKRSQAATKESRIAAAAAFISVAWIASYLMEALAAPVGLPRLLVIVAIIPLCVFVDRLVAVRAAPVDQTKADSQR